MAMTERLYYTDSYQTEFDAVVMSVTTLDGRPALVLDRSCFYPTSGGQPNDLGMLDLGARGSRQVVGVVAGEGTAGSSIVHHVLDAPPALPVGSRVHGVIDWTRRYDHMQQHSGQHLLSQIFARRFKCETVSVHFGADESTLDLDTATVDPVRIEEAEAMANDLVYTNLPITAYFVTDSDLHRVPLRRPPAVTGQIRIVEIAEFDFSACGGTHVQTTAEIGPVKLVRQERRRGQTRVTFLCGKRALADYGRKHRLLTQTAALFSTDVGQVPTLVAAGLEQNKTLQHRVDELIAQQLTYTSRDLLTAAQLVGADRVVAAVLDLPVDALKTLANLLQTEPHTLALLGSAAGGKATAVFARSADASPHMGNLLRAALATLGGSGGGRPEFAQGGGIPVEKLDELLQAAVAQLR